MSSDDNCGILGQRETVAFLEEFLSPELPRVFLGACSAVVAHNSKILAARNREIFR